MPSGYPPLSSCRWCLQISWLLHFMLRTWKLCSCCPSAQSLLSSWWYWFLYGWSSTIDAFRCLKEFIFQITSWTQKKSVSSISGSSCHHPELYYEIVNSLVMISGHKAHSSNSLRIWFLVYLLSYPRKIYKLSVLLLQSVSPLWLYFLSPHLYPRSWASSTPPFFPLLWSPNKSQPWINQAIYPSLFLISECQVLFGDHKTFTNSSTPTPFGFPVPLG